MYTVDVQVTDDNGGTDFATLPKIITDNCDCAKGLGFWKKEFKIRSEKDDKKVEKGTLIDEPTLAAYLDIIRFGQQPLRRERAPDDVRGRVQSFESRKAPWHRARLRQRKWRQ